MTRCLYASVRLPLVARRTVAVSLVLAAGLSSPARVVHAQVAQGPSGEAEMPDVVVSASRREQQSFDAPAAIQSVGRETIEEAGPQVNLSESINRIPGVIARNDGNDRFFEPAPGRTWLLAAQVGYRF